MTYKVPLIPPNLRKNETIVQIADSLHHLSKILDDIMVHIERRIDTNAKKLDNISTRLNLAEEKISHLGKVKNAVQIFSSSHYPAGDIERKYVPIFPADSDIPMLRHKVNDKYPMKNDEPLDKLHFYHVQIRPIETTKTTGLGGIPRDLNCVNNLLLYNSGKNLYKEFKMSDSLQITRPKVKTEENEFLIGVAPVSIGDRTQNAQNINQTYFYSPDLGEVPSLDIPLDLPDLPGIADNIKYEDENNVMISPSVAMSPTSHKGSLEIEEDLTNLPDMIPSSPSPPPPPPPPPPAQQILPMVPQTVEFEEKLEQKVDKESVLPLLDEDEPHTNVPDVLDARANLMEAIREAGGRKKLKSVQLNNTSKVDKSGGDLMADLHAKLAMRRKGISGTQQQVENLDSRGTLSLMSALIPAPTESNEDSTDQDDDWE